MPDSHRAGGGRFAVAVTWETQRERGTAFMLRCLRFVALRCGRRFARLVLYPVTGYFLLTSATTRRVSREYLSRVLPDKPRIADVARHVFAFASTSLDRIFLLTNSHVFKVRFHGVQRAIDLAGQSGVLLFVAHFGSFEILRVGAENVHRLPLKIVLDGNVGKRFMTSIAELNPQIAAGIIDSANRGPDLALVLREALAQNTMVGLMVDRIRKGDRSVSVDFLGGQARFPANPWLLAAALRVPVIAAFSVYRGGDQYDVSFEIITERVELPRQKNTR